MDSNRSRTSFITLTAAAALLTACQVHSQAGLHAGAAAPAMAPTPVATGHAAVSVEVHVSFFGVPLDGADDVVFVLDRSGSMGLMSAGVSGKALGMSKTKSALASLGGSLVNSAAFIRGIKPGGSTAAVPAMRLAYRMGAQRIVLLSDGLANSGGNGRDLLAEARPQMHAGLRIDTVGLGLDQDDSLLQSLAAESGGLAVMR